MIVKGLCRTFIAMDLVTNKYTKESLFHLFRIKVKEVIYIKYLTMHLQL